MLDGVARSIHARGGGLSVIDEIEFYEEVHMYHYGKYPLLIEALKNAQRPHAQSMWSK